MSPLSSHPLDLDFIRRNVPCQWACPAKTDVPSYILACFRGEHNKSYSINHTANLFPAILGRVCSRPCELACRHGEPDLGQPVAICHLKRFSADLKSKDYTITEEMFSQSGKKVAVVGAGPAGLAVSHSLSLFGHRVDLFDSYDKPGGMLIQGIPDFRLPRNIIDEEIFSIMRLGIRAQLGKRLGVDFQIKDLLQTYDAVVLALGCMKPRKLGCGGEDLVGVFSGLDFMAKVNSKHPPTIGKTVIVIGGGFTAMDCSRSAVRLGAQEVIVAIRTTEEEMSVTREEITEAKREGIRIMPLVSTLEILGQERVTGVRFARNRIRIKREKGMRVPEIIENSDFVIRCDTVVSAIGQSPDYGLLEEFEKKVTFDQSTGGSSIKGLFGAGDFITGASTVIQAIGHAKKVAENVDEFLMGRTRRHFVVEVEPAEDTHRKRQWDFIPRQIMPHVDVNKRYCGVEVELGYTEEHGLKESMRCYLCNLKYEINGDKCIFCRWCIDVCPRQCIHLAKDVDQYGRISKATKWNEVKMIVIDNDRCIRCGFCLRVCPVQCINVKKTTLKSKLIEG